jgi:hypothetical protein
VKLKLTKCVENAKYARAGDRAGPLFVGAPHSPSKTGANALVVGAPARGEAQGGHKGRPYAIYPSFLCLTAGGQSMRILLFFTIGHFDFAGEFRREPINNNSGSDQIFERS